MGCRPLAPTHANGEAVADNQHVLERGRGRQVRAGLAGAQGRGALRSRAAVARVHCRVASARDQVAGGAAGAALVAAGAVGGVGPRAAAPTLGLREAIGRAGVFRAAPHLRPSVAGGLRGAEVGALGKGGSQQRGEENCAHRKKESLCSLRVVRLNPVSLGRETRATRGIKYIFVFF